MLLLLGMAAGFFFGNTTATIGLFLAGAHFIGWLAEHKIETHWCMDGHYCRVTYTLELLGFGIRVHMSFEQ